MVDGRGQRLLESLSLDLRLVRSPRYLPIPE
jgi:hypothetical protein